MRVRVAHLNGRLQPVPRVRGPGVDGQLHEGAIHRPQALHQQLAGVGVVVLVGLARLEEVLAAAKFG